MGRLFYNTNGFAFHRLEDAVAILADLGYDGVAWTPDVHHLDPLRASDRDIEAFRRVLSASGLELVVETGARFVLDARRKHRPTLLDDRPGARRRRTFLERCVELAAALGAPLVSVWSGAAPAGQEPAESMARLVAGLEALCRHAEACGVRIGFEPEPGMFIERTDEWPALRDAVAHPALGLTLDVGHCRALREGAPQDVLRRHAADLVALHLDDHRAGRHEHLAFGEGEIDFAAVAAAVRDVGFQGPLEVELSRHAAMAPAVAEASLAFLRPLFG